MLGEPLTWYRRWPEPYNVALPAVYRLALDGTVSKVRDVVFHWDWHRLIADDLG